MKEITEEAIAVTANAEAGTVTLNNIGFAAKSNGNIISPNSPIGVLIKDNTVSTTWCEYNINNKTVDNITVGELIINVTKNTNINKRSCKIYLKNKLGYESKNYILITLYGLLPNIVRFYSIDLSSIANPFIMFKSGTSTTAYIDIATYSTDVLENFQKSMTNWNNSTEYYIYAATYTLFGNHDIQLDSNDKLIIGFIWEYKYGQYIFNNSPTYINTYIGDKTNTVCPNVALTMNYSPDLTLSGMKKGEVDTLKNISDFNNVSNLRLEVLVGYIRDNEHITFTKCAKCSLNFESASDDINNPTVLQ